MCKIMQHLCFCAWVILLNTTFSNFTCVVSGKSISIFLLLNNISSLYAPIFFIMNAHQYWFSILIIVNNSIINMELQISLQYPYFLWTYTKSGVDRSSGHSFIIFSTYFYMWRSLHIFSARVVLIHIRTNSKDSLFSTCSST